ncbi:hypothetical protein Q5752_005351 [Cryptotrichosporon argae]
MLSLRSLFAAAGPSRLPLLATLRGTTVPVTAAPSRAFSASPVAQLLKTHSGTKKRFRATAGGLFKRAQAGKQHLNTGFSASRINRLSRTVYATKAQAKHLRRLMPYT